MQNYLHSKKSRFRVEAGLQKERSEEKSKEKRRETRFIFLDVRMFLLPNMDHDVSDEKIGHHEI